MKEIKSIKALPDGGYDVLFDEDGSRYACQIYDRAEVQQFTFAEITAAIPDKLDADPGLAPGFQTVAQIAQAAYAADASAWKEARCDECDSALQSKLKAGFLYGTRVIQADPVALQNATGYLVAVSSGLVSGTIRWRTADNEDLDLSAADFALFAATMLYFVQARYAEVWAAKDAIRAAESFETAYAAFTGYVG